MKKISLVFGMILAVALSLTSCKQPADPELTAEDYTTNTEWMLGTWKITTTIDVSDVKYSGDVPEEGKKMFEMLKTEVAKVDPETTVEITKDNIEIYKAILKAYVEPTDTQLPMKGLKVEQSIDKRINKDKTVITIYADGSISYSEGGASAAFDISETVIWEKQ